MTESSEGEEFNLHSNELKTRKKENMLQSFIKELNDGQMIKQIDQYLDSHYAPENPKKFFLYHDLLIIKKFLQNEIGMIKKTEVQMISQLKNETGLKDIKERIRKKLSKLKKEDLHYHIVSGENIIFKQKTYVKNDIRKQQSKFHPPQYQKIEKKPFKQTETISINSDDEGDIELDNIFMSGSITFPEEVLIKKQNNRIIFTTKKKEEEKKQIRENLKRIYQQEVNEKRVYEEEADEKRIYEQEEMDERIQQPINVDKNDQIENSKIQASENELQKFSNNLKSYELFKLDPEKYKYLEWIQDEDEILEMASKQEKEEDKLKMLEMVKKHKGLEITKERLAFLNLEELANILNDQSMKE